MRDPSLSGPANSYLDVHQSKSNYNYNYVAKNKTHNSRKHKQQNVNNAYYNPVNTSNYPVHIKAAASSADACVSRMTGSQSAHGYLNEMPPFYYPSYPTASFHFDQPPPVVPSQQGQRPANNHHTIGKDREWVAPEKYQFNQEWAWQFNENPSNLKQLDDEIYAHFARSRQKDSLFRRKMDLRLKLADTIKTVYPKSGLYIIGSSINGFGTNCSDLDLCLMVTRKDVNQRTLAISVLSVVSRTLDQSLCDLVRSQQLIDAKVPILRVQFGGPYEHMQVDLNVNNQVAIMNTHLLWYYASYDARVQPLVCVVKEWARRHGVNDASRGTFSSYSLVLMLIHFLQFGLFPSVLPSLHKLYPHKFSHQIDVRELCIGVALPAPARKDVQPRDEALNTQSVGELLLGFLCYYARIYNYEQTAISVRRGTIVPRSVVMAGTSRFNHHAQWRCVCIEEPFTCTNTAHSVYDADVLYGLKRVFEYSYVQLWQQRHVASILQCGALYVLPVRAAALKPAFRMNIANTYRIRNSDSRSSCAADEQNDLADKDKEKSTKATTTSGTEVAELVIPKSSWAKQLHQKQSQRTTYYINNADEYAHHVHEDVFTGCDLLFHQCRVPPVVAAPPVIEPSSSLTASSDLGSNSFDEVSVLFSQRERYVQLQSLGVHAMSLSTCSAVLPVYVPVPVASTVMPLQSALAHTTHPATPVSPMSSVVPCGPMSPADPVAVPFAAHAQPARAKSMSRTESTVSNSNGEELLDDWSSSGTRSPSQYTNTTSASSSERNTLSPCAAVCELLQGCLASNASLLPVRAPNTALFSSYANCVNGQRLQHLGSGTVRSYAAAASLSPRKNRMSSESSPSDRSRTSECAELD